MSYNAQDVAFFGSSRRFAYGLGTHKIDEGGDGLTLTERWVLRLICLDNRHTKATWSANRSFTSFESPESPRLLGTMDCRCLLLSDSSVGQSLGSCATSTPEHLPTTPMSPFPTLFNL